jgi:NTE family protein
MVNDAVGAAVAHDPILVDLALQGGGSHGAFTWGVLDRLLEEPWLGIDGISGTSAGAMNAAVLVDGHAEGGAAGARTALENFWRRVSEAARFSPLRRGPLDVILGRWTLDSSPIYVAMDLMSHLVSPYDLNPMGKNPLRAILAEQSISSGWQEHRRNSSSRQPMSGPAAVTCSGTTLLRRTFCSPPPVCPPCFRL